MGCILGYQERVEEYIQVSPMRQRSLKDFEEIVQELDLGGIGDNRIY